MDWGNFNGIQHGILTQMYPYFIIYKQTLSAVYVADRQGFEPWRRSPAYTLSRRAPSTTRPPIRCAGFSAALVAMASPLRQDFQ